MMEIITTAITALKSIGINIQGKTKHLGWANTTNVVKPVSITIDSLIQSNVSSSDYNELNSMNFAYEVRQYIRDCIWWKVGNDQEVAVSNDEPAGTLQDSIWRVLLWGIDNSPVNNYSDGYNAITEVFENTFYNTLRQQGNDSLVFTIDYLLSQMCSQFPLLYNSNSSDKNMLDKVNELLNKKTTSTTSQNNSSQPAKNNSSMIIFAVILIIAGIFFIGKK